MSVEFLSQTFNCEFVEVTGYYTILSFKNGVDVEIFNHIDPSIWPYMEVSDGHVTIKSGNFQKFRNNLSGPKFTVPFKHQDLQLLRSLIDMYARIHFLVVIEIVVTPEDIIVDAKQFINQNPISINIEKILESSFGRARGNCIHIP